MSTQSQKRCSLQSSSRVKVATDFHSSETMTIRQLVLKLYTLSGASSSLMDVLTRVCEPPVQAALVRQDPVEQSSKMLLF